jgi:hypothetical protein
VLDQRGQLLRAALGFAGLPRPSYDRSLWALRTWLDSWSGIGRVAVGMARQGYARYDEKGWCATSYTTGMEHSPTSATGRAWERTSWHDAAGSMGGAEEIGNRLTVRATVPYALELPCCEAAEVDVELVESRVVTIAGELDLELQLILRDGLAKHAAEGTYSRPPQVRSARRDGSFPVPIASWAFERSNFSSGLVTLQGLAVWSCQMPGGSDACSRHPGGPYGRQREVYTS